MNALKTLLAPNTFLAYFLLVLAAMAILLAADWSLADPAFAATRWGC